MMWAVVVQSLAGCTTGVVDVFQTCEIDVVLSPTAAAPGTTVSATGGPYTIVRDTRINVGGVPAEVTVVTRENCEECDTCRLEADCAPCGPCFGEVLEVDERKRCFGDGLADPPIQPVCDTCAESLAFVVPAGAPLGPTAVYVVNANGASDLVPFEVLPGISDTSDTSDTDVSDTDGTP